MFKYKTENNVKCYSDKIIFSLFKLIVQQIRICRTLPCLGKYV